MKIELTTPPWFDARLASLPAALATREERMKAVLELARRNFEENTGGPFAALVVERDTGRVVAGGVNRVVPMNCSSAHAEVVALSLAQQRLGTYDLGGPALPAHQLVVNWTPCAMCMGATLWSGIRSLVIAGAGPECEQITGFDEGPIHPEWRRECERRGVEVIDNVLRRESVEVFEAFAKSGRPVYNGRQGQPG